MPENLIELSSSLLSTPKTYLGTECASFSLGDIVSHKKHGYKGLIFDVDPVYCQSEEWYALMASSNPPKNIPWYHIVVDGEEHTTYVPQCNLIINNSDPMEIEHPLVSQFFQLSSDGLLLPKKLIN